MDANGKFDLNHTGLIAYSHGEYLSLGEKLGQFGYSVRKKAGQTKKKADRIKGKDVSNKAGTKERKNVPNKKQNGRKKKRIE